MSDADPSAPIPRARGDSSQLQGLDPGELLARGLDTVKPSVGAGPWEPPTPEEVGRLLPQYRIESLIGRGGMGAVYKGIQLNLDRPVAIKLLPAEIAADAQFVARFEREARTLAKLQHSRIVTIHDFGRTSEGHLYFVMEYIDGTDLRRILKGPGLGPDEALAVVGQLCDALQAAHREGIVHRDIKPENVLITRDGYVKLADFGLSRPSQEEGTSVLTNTNVVMGTPDYMAPEQRDGVTKADQRSDIFALGVMFYEMLTGQTPRGVFDPPSHKVSVDVRIDEVVLKALQSEPGRRYQKVSELKTAIDDIRTTPLPVPAAAAAAPPQPTAPLRKKSNVLVLAGVAGGLLLLVVAAVFFWLGRKHDSAPVEPQIVKTALTTEIGEPVASAKVTDLPAKPAPSSEPVAESKPAEAEPKKPEPAEPAAKRSNPARDLYEALVGNTWEWLSAGKPVSFVTFNPDGHVSGGWTWELAYKDDGRPFVDCIWGDNGHQYLVFDQSLTAFESYDSRANCVAKGRRGEPNPQAGAPAERVAAEPRPTAPNAPAIVEIRLAVDPQKGFEARHGKEVRVSSTNVAHFKLVPGLKEPRLVSLEAVDSTGAYLRHQNAIIWLHQRPQKVDLIYEGNASFKLIHLDGDKYRFEASGLADMFITARDDGSVVLAHDPRPERSTFILKPVGTGVDVASRTQPVSTAKPGPISPAALRARQVYDALVGYHWTWANVGDNKPPLVVDFTWDGHVSGGWTWEMVYKPDGETLVHCNWNGNGHQYMRMNAACDAFDAFDNDGKFKVKGKRLGALDQPVNLAGYGVPQAPPEQKAPPPSKRIEPLLEPCLGAILSPLEGNPQMPRVAVETLRASFGAGIVKARTTAQKQIYQYGMAVCEALTNGMDERAQARVAASTSAQVPSLFEGRGIVKTMPLRGWDAGHLGDAIRKKQKDERNYVDKLAKGNSNFTDTAAYKAWIARSAMLRENVMGLYTKLVQLEAADPASEAGAATVPPVAK